MEQIVHIIAGCRRGDDNCRRKLYEHYKGFALKVVFRFIFRYETAVDVTNDGFVKAFLNIHHFYAEEEEHTEKVLMAWLKRIMINTAIDELRRKKMIPEIGLIPDQVWAISQPGDNADQLIIYKDLIILLKKLPPLYRSIFNLYVIDGYTHHEIADLLQIPLGTSKSGLSRARALLQKSIRLLEDQSYVSVR